MHYFKIPILLGSLIFSNIALAQLFQGELEVLISDDFSHNKSTTIYKLHQGNETYLLDLPPSLNKKELLTGVHVSIEGQEKMGLSGVNDNEIKVQSLEVKKNPFAELALSEERKAITLLVNFRNLKASDVVSMEQLDNILYTGPRSMQKSFAISSFNQVNFIRDSNSDGNADIYTINLDYDATDCDTTKWTDDATNAAAAKGVNMSLYKHILLVLPKDVKCSWAGVAHLGCGTTCNAWVKAYDPNEVYSQLVYTHELGHNVGMAHAATDIDNAGNILEYGDIACTMGAGDAKYFKEVNAPHRDQMHWFDSFPNNIKTITVNGVYTLYPLESSTCAPGLITLKLKRNATDTYYISYRKNIGPFGPGAPTYLDKVSIHRTSGTSTQTFLTKILGLNESFVDNENKITIKVTALGDTANVNVTFGSIPETLSAFTFFKNDNTDQVKYADWDPQYWKGNCQAYSETVGLSAAISNKRPNSIACLIKNSSTTTASGEFVKSLGSATSDARSFSRNNDWDAGYYKWECGLNEYVSGFSQHATTNQLHKIRCAKGAFTNGGQNSCETRFVSNGGDDRGSKVGGDWDPNFYKSQCSAGKIIFGVSIYPSTKMPHKILCCNK
jgi:hypothetical protein